jgi:hypothetical protein
MPEERVEEGAGGVEMPAAMAWPLVLGVGVVLLAAGVATSLAFSLVGAVLFAVGLGRWIGQLLPGRGHVHEPRVEPALRPRPVTGAVGAVERMTADRPGYRLRLPEKVHPISAGIKGGIVGGLVMPIPALIYGVQSGHGVWFPINLLAGMVLPGMDELPVEQLKQFHLGWLLLAVVIHAVMSVVIGLLYGVLLPTMPPLPGGPVIWGGLLVPLIWTALSYLLMGVVNPVLQEHVDWRWFLVSQFVFGVAASLVVVRSEKVHIPPAGTDAEPPPGPVVV